MSATPQYRVLEPFFCEPDLLPAGSIIATDAPPGPHLEPWNEEAKARYEEWLGEGVPELDAKTRKPTGEMIYPHAKYRRVDYEAAERQTAVVLAEPEVGDGNGQTLAQLRQVKPTDQRPPPASRFKTASPMAATPEPKKAEVLHVPPPTTTIKGGPGT